jgi:serine/threonine protein kinase
VFKARHQHLDRLVAVKVVRKDRVTSPNLLKRFLREMQAAGQMSHPTKARRRRRAAAAACRCLDTMV